MPPGWIQHSSWFVTYRYFHSLMGYLATNMPGTDVDGDGGSRARLFNGLIRDIYTAEGNFVTRIPSIYYVSVISDRNYVNFFKLRCAAQIVTI